MFVRKTLLAALCATTLLPLTAVYAADAQQFPSEQGSITATPIAKGLDHP
ncbi:MAG: PQQ-dependent sugar dehydrogenase, partial [Pseudomonas sp.]